MEINFKIRNCLSITFFALILFLLVAKNADAAVLSKASNNLGLVGYWTFNEGTSTVALDYSGNKNNGTLVNGPTWTSGKQGKALNFDGVNDSVSTADAAILEFPEGTNGTVSFWFRLKAYSSGTDAHIVDKYYSIVGIGGYFFRMTDTDSDGTYDDLRYFVHGTSNSSGGGAGINYTNILLNTWYQVVGTITTTGDATALYVNGVLVSNNNGNLLGGVSGNGKVLTFGKASTGNTNFLTGLIDDVRVYNRALTPSEVEGLYNSGAAKFQVPNNQGLVGYWTFNEGTSTVALDYSGNGNKGTLVNFASAASSTSGWVNGKLGKALNFDGVNDYVTLTNSSSIKTMNSAGTINFWIRLNAAADNNDMPIDISGTGSKGLVVLFNTNQTISLQYGNGITTTSPDSTTALAVGQWYMFTGTWTSAGGVVYINGVQEAINSNAPLISITGTTEIGSNSGSQRFVNGLIDDVRIYNRALTPSEVEGLYNSGAAKFQAPNNSGLVGYWTFNEGTSTKALDYSGNGNKGTLVKFASAASSTSGWANGKIGKALNFDGVNDYMEFPDTSLSSTFTIGMWVKQRTARSDHLFGRIDNTTDKAWLNDSGALTLRIDNNNSTSIQIGFPTSWTHLTIVRNANNQVELYMNGSAQGWGASVAGNLNIDKLGHGASGTTFWNGLIDDIRIYNRALSADEVLKLYNSGK